MALNGRRLRMETIQRYAEWTGPEWTGLMLRNGARFHQGPLVQLELGTRVATAILCPGRDA